MIVLCAYCLNLSNNAAMPVQVVNQGAPVGPACIGPDVIVEQIGNAYNLPGPHAIRLRSYQLETDPHAVTFIDGTACCATHVDRYARWPLNG